MDFPLGGVILGNDLNLSSPLELNKHFSSVGDLQTLSLHAAVSPLARVSCWGRWF